MRSPELESKRIFLVACQTESLTLTLTQIIQDQIKNPTLFTSTDGTEALFKADNVRPHVAILQTDLPKTDGYEVATKLITKIVGRSVSVILVGELPDQEHFVDQVVTGQVQFITPSEILEKLPSCLARALNRISLEDHSTYKMRFLSKGQILFHEGDQANSVFIVKSGTLSAIKGAPEKAVILGEILPGEFVGEMSHFNDENRSATVRAVSDCELIEIPRGSFDFILFSKPAWAKALIETLSKRLKVSNALALGKVT
jgi:CRP-like cAMP-binding protein